MLTGAINAFEYASISNEKILLVLFFIVKTGLSQGQAPLKLWYKQPAGTTWENALPIGNGRLGAMIYGSVTKEIIQLNEHTVWSGSPNRNDNPLALEKLAEIRKLIFEGRHKEAEKLANETIISKKSHGQKFEPVGNLNLIFKGHIKSGTKLKAATGKNSNPFFASEMITSAIISEKSTIQPLVLKETQLFDLPTQKG
ncbi:glycoside hydrolase N-terminal domain-containing protein [Emticicia agri]|uniref:glycoside hydrolase N-terminal domain-containing protein n=1 Tax=Emticicia agri TaxID=2492393 RepID=UPI00267FA2B6